MLDDTADDIMVIGMARIIGDGVLNLYIQDVIIAKAYRRQKLGTLILNHLITLLHNKFPADCTIGLMAAKGQTQFYNQFGFETRPNNDVDAGMSAALRDLSLRQ